MATAAAAAVVQVGDWKCAAPEIQKTTVNGALSTFYRFPVTHAPHDMVVYLLSLTEGALKGEVATLIARDGEYHSYIVDFLTYFLEENAKLFVKRHAPAAYVRILNHEFLNMPTAPEIGREAPNYTLILNPVEFHIKNGKLTFIWNVEQPAVEVQDDDGASIRSSVEIVEAANDIMEVADIEDAEGAEKELTIGSGSAAAHRMSDRQFRDRQRVEEARLRAKLATVRAERALERYIAKYGEYESDGSDEDGETTDGESIM